MDKTFFICPQTHKELFEKRENGQRCLTTDSDITYDFINEFPNLTYPKKLEKETVEIFEHYDGTAAIYDNFLNQTFKTHNEDEVAARNKFIDKLNINSDSKVLEIACATGRDSELILKRLGKGGKSVMVDISPNMLAKCREKLSGIDIDKTFCIANASYLPFPDRYFDAVYSFAALGYFPDVKRSLAEMVRVTKVGGKIVVGDESMPPWLRDTYFSNVLANTNPRVLIGLPLNDIPVDARNVTVQWVVGGIFYLIDFEVGEGEPKGNFDYEVAGPARGGTLRTRYEGKLEGVTKETKELAYKAAKAKGVTMHKWLDDLVKESARKDLDL
jgi:ubiquinone/menaquinone biosynthesis C-methylase UbiE